MPQTLYASFVDPENAERAAGSLLDFGVREDDLSVIANENYNWRTTTTADAGRLGGETRGAILERPADGGHFRESAIGDRLDSEVANIIETNRVEAEKFEADRTDDLESAAKHGISTTTAADAEAGAATGAGIGLGVGVLAGVASLAFVPGVGALLGAGLLAQAIGLAVAGAAGTTAAGAIAGGVTGYLKDQGVDTHVAEQYNDIIVGGGAILAVTLPSGKVGYATGRALLEKYGAENISSH